MTDLSPTEAAFLAATPDDMPDAAAITAGLPEAPALDLSPDAAPKSANSDLMTLEDFTDQFIFLHHLGQSAIESKTGEDTCPIGNQAESQGGRKAAAAAYRVISRNSMIAGMFLSKGDGLLTDLLAVGMHAFACRNIVAMALANPQSNGV